MKTGLRKWIVLLSLAMISTIPGAALAEAMPDDPGDSGGIPAWSVARLKVVEGSAWVLSPGESDWAELEGNAPLPADSRVRVPSGSAAELRFDGGQAVRLREGADVELYRLSEDRVSLLLHEGRAAFRLPEDDFFVPFNVVLPDEQVVRFTMPGRYRIQAAGKGEESLVQVIQGEARIKVGEGRHRVRAGEEASVGDGVAISRLADTGGDFDEPQYAELAPVERAVEAPPTVVYELRDYGDWVTVPSYGTVWRPRVAAGWSPYYYGRWVWVSSIGWSWISSEPWGWYPYRCGNWIQDASFGWVWSPYRSFISVSFSSGHRHFRPARYYPATVRFVRDGGNVRWVPLRPGERFVRPGLPRNEGTLRRWYEPLKRDTVFVRDPARRDGQGQWRDSHVERPSGRTVVKPPPVVRPDRGIRTMPDRGGRSIGRTPDETPQRDRIRENARPRPAPGEPGSRRELRSDPGPVRESESGRTIRPESRRESEPRPAIRQPRPEGGREGGSYAPSPPGRREQPSGRPAPQMIDPQPRPDPVPRSIEPRRAPEPQRFQERPARPADPPAREQRNDRIDRGRGGDGGFDRGGGSERGGGRDRR